MTVRILIVCTGNTCRSPLAEGILRTAAARRGLDVTVSSAGTSAWDGAPASDGSLLVGLERGVDLNGHRARLLTPPLVADADLILVMGPHHLDQAVTLGGAGKTHLLTAFASGGAEQRAISDPFGGDLPVYRETADELDRVIEQVLDRLTAAEQPGSP